MEKIVNYKAEDGTIFETEAGCLAYEKGSMPTFIERNAYYEWEDSLDDIPGYIGAYPEDMVFLTRITDEFFEWTEKNNIKVICPHPINDYKWQTVVLCAESLAPGSTFRIPYTLRALIEGMRIDIESLSNYL